MRPPTFARAPGILFIFLSSHEFLLLVKIRKTPETENDKNEKDPTTYETQTFPEPGRELRDEVVRETGGRTGASGSVMKSFKMVFITFYLFIVYGAYKYILVCTGSQRTIWGAPFLLLPCMFTIWLMNSERLRVDELLLAQDAPEEHSALSAWGARHKQGLTFPLREYRRKAGHGHHSGHEA